MWILLLLVGLTIYFYLSYTSVYGYWRKRGVTHPPVSKLFGNVGKALILKKSLPQIYNEIYRAYPSLRYVGFYRVRQPGLIIRDPQLIKEVLVKSFNSFQENDILVNEDVDPLITRDPLFIKGEKWRAARAHQAPCFTGNKVKAMYPLMEAASDRLASRLNETDCFCVDVKKLTAKYTMDIVASCGFGLEANCIEDPNSEFRRMSQRMLSQSFAAAVKHVLQFVMPPLAKLLKTKFVPDDVAHYFRKLISETLQYRKEYNIVRNDFLDTMIEYKCKLGEGVFTNEDVTGNAVGFIFDGFETSSVTLSFTLYELGANPDVQEKLKAEIDDILETYCGTLSYDAIQDMVYLDKIFNESLRMHPAGLFLGKICTNPFTLPPPAANGKEVRIESGTPIVVPVYGLHYDAKYYTDPEQFDPERFSEENNKAREKYTYLPFGDGPRVCLGQRFAAAQVKIALVNLVSNFEIRINKKTVTPLEVDPTYIILAAKGGIWLDFHKRSK